MLNNINNLTLSTSSLRHSIDLNSMQPVSSKSQLVFKSLYENNKLKNNKIKYYFKKNYEKILHENSNINFLINKERVLKKKYIYKIYAKKIYIKKKFYIDF